MENSDLKLIDARPTKRQIDYLENGYNCFIHYSMNTYTGSEWGSGKESPEQFCPKHVNTDGWALAAKEAGMGGIILTCKHHDGFCLWPSKYTEHSIKNSPYKNGKGDIVRELSDSCRKYGIKFGVYLSPWDRNCSHYGKGKEYDDYYVNQMTELLTQYGDIFAVWLDGACGENAQGKKQRYDWKRYFDTVRKLQPNSVISICGPDIRWCGNEAGKARKSEWSVVSKALSDPSFTSELSQKEDDSEFRKRPVDASMEDLGSREALKNEKDLIYYPSEMDVSIRPGWFYHADEDDKVRSVDNLFDIYLTSVGHNSTLLLNIPVMPDGNMNSIDEDTIKILGQKIRNSFKNNLAEDAEITFDKDSAQRLKISIKWNEAKTLNYLQLGEDIRYSQRVEKYKVFSIGNDGSKELLTSGTTIGFKEIIPLNGYKTGEIIVEIQDSRSSPLIGSIGVF